MLAQLARYLYLAAIAALVAAYAVSAAIATPPPAEPDEIAVVWC